MSAAQKTLILGGARSGKSKRGLMLAHQADQDLIFIATAQALDQEMNARIDQHRLERGPEWTTIEVPVHLPDAIMAHSGPQTLCLVDCLTLWLSNLMHHGHDVEQAGHQLCSSVEAAAGSLILVSNEVGLGLVPETSLGRHFRDEQGRLNQYVATVCDRVEFVAAGLPITLKG